MVYLVKLGCPDTNQLESPISAVGSLYFNCCINFPLDSDPKLLISLINLQLQPGILLLELPVLQAHGLHLVLLVDVRHEFFGKHALIPVALQEAAGS